MGHSPVLGKCAQKCELGISLPMGGKGALALELLTSVRIRPLAAHEC